MKFSYTALSAENKKLTGLLDAQSLDLAKEELHKMGVSILSIQEITEEAFNHLNAEADKTKVQEGITTFTFRAVDPTGKEIEGTIDSKSSESALKRLLLEYRFLVKELYPSTATPEERQVAEVSLKALLTKLKGEGIEMKASAKKTEYEEMETVIDAKITAEIDKIIVTAKKIIQENNDLYTTARFGELQKTLGELERVRTSNNFRHISEVSNKLHSLLSHPDAMTSAQVQGRTGYQDLLKEFQGASIIKHEGDFYKKSALLKQLNSLWKKIAHHLPLKRPAPLPKEAAKPAKEVKKEATSPKARAKKDFTPFFAELNHFLGWLLTFYLLYFLAVDFALEKGVGLSREFVFRTLQTPLLLQITFFLLTTHFLVHLKIRHFRGNFIGSTFLILFGYGVYTFILLNS